MDGKLRISGVPEHFCLPWMLCLEEDKSIDVIFSDAPGGTGQMMASLLEGEVDVVISLTEGTIMFQERHQDVIEVVSVYVESPLQWGVHLRGNSGYVTQDDIPSSVRIAISRFGSGSHLMAYVFAEKMGWDVGSLKFVAVGGLSGALKAFEEDSVDLFLWDTYMTSGLVEQGVLKRVGVMPSPWPCFVVATTKSVLEKRREELLSILSTVSKRALAMPNDQGIIDRLCTKYRLSPENAITWLKTTKFAAMPLPLQPETVDNVKRYLPK